MNMNEFGTEIDYNNLEFHVGLFIPENALFPWDMEIVVHANKAISVC